jgi:hypothetical protein
MFVSGTKLQFPQHMVKTGDCLSFKEFTKEVLKRINHVDSTQNPTSSTGQRTVQIFADHMHLSKSCVLVNQSISTRPDLSIADALNSMVNTAIDPVLDFSVGIEMAK